MDSAFLKDTVGEALAKGCAACCVAQPLDPVTYLAEWLLNSVRSGVLLDEHAAKKKAEAEEAEKAAVAALEEVPMTVSGFKGELDTVAVGKTFVDVFRDASNKVVGLTGASSCYVAMVTEALDVEAELPEDLEEGKVPQIEDVLAVKPRADEEGEESTTEAEEAAAEEGGEELKEKDEGIAEAEIDYSTVSLEYVAASSGQDFMLYQSLQREGSVTFELLDGERLSMSIPNVMYKEGVRFFKNIPRVGAYFAVKILNDKKCVAVLAADSLMPQGSGRPFTDEDVDTILEVSRALSSALANLEKVDPEEGAQSLSVLQSELAGMTFLEFEEPSNTAEELNVLRKKKSFAQDQMTKVISAIQMSGTRCIDQILSATRTPQASYKILKAVGLVLRPEEKEPSTWIELRTSLTQGIVDEMLTCDVESVTDVNVWRRVWQITYGVTATALNKESVGGALMLKWLIVADRIKKLAVQIVEIEAKLAEEEAEKAAAEAEAEATAESEGGEETAE